MYFVGKTRMVTVEIQKFQKRILEQKTTENSKFRKRFRVCHMKHDRSKIDRRISRLLKSLVKLNYSSFAVKFEAQNFVAHDLISVVSAERIT